MANINGSEIISFFLSDVLTSLINNHQMKTIEFTGL